MPSSALHVESFVEAPDGKYALALTEYNGSTARPPVLINLVGELSVGKMLSTYCAAGRNL